MPNRDRVAPELAVVRDESDGATGGHLLAERARQVFDLLRENARLRTAVHEAGFRTGDEASSPFAIAERESDTAAERAPLTLPRHDEPLVSIVIPVHDEWEYTYACLRTIVEATADVAYEVILADDGSSDDTRAAESLIENIRMVRSTNPQGFVPPNCNAAARRLRRVRRLLLNNDTEVQPGLLEAPWRSPPRPRPSRSVAEAVYPTGRPQEAGGIMSRTASGT